MATIRVVARPETSEQSTCYRHKGVGTQVTCADCGKPICPECMVFGPVGIRCPDCAGQGTRPRRGAQGVRRVATSGRADLATRALIIVNVLIYLAELAQSGSFSATSSQLVLDGALFGPAVADGEWYRLVTAGFLHANLIHIGFNMLMLWWFGRSLEVYLGRWRFVGLYVVSLLAGSAGALLFSPNALTVGASGAVFGILGAGLFLERRQVYVFGGSAMTIVVLNLAISFAFPGISVGGHLGGLVGGVGAILVLSRLGRSNPAYSRFNLQTAGGLAAIAVAAIIVSYLRVRGLT